MKHAGYLPLFCILLCNSCGKVLSDAYGPDRDAQVCVSAICSKTRSVADGGMVPCDYTIWLSSYLTSGNSPEADGDYFIGKPFVCEGTLWRSKIPVFWPLGGHLDFLAIATSSQGGRIAAGTRWHSPDCTLGAEITVEDSSLDDSELLYSAAEGRLEDGNNVRMEFHHSQAWLQFRLSAAEENLVRIDSICIRKTYTGGLLRICRGIYLSAEWEFRGFRRRDAVVPGTRSVVLHEGAEVVCGILLPEQNSCDITVCYTVKPYPESGWEEAESRTYTHPAGADPWYSGTKTLYEIGFRQKAIGIQTSVQEWEEDSRDIIVNNN